MNYLVGATRTQIIRLPHLEPGTRVLATERIPSGQCHAVEGMDAETGLCGAELVEVFNRSFTEDADLQRCAECQALVGPVETPTAT
jgi:hypothetical protein